MRLLKSRQSDELQLVLHLGLGLIGRSIQRHLKLAQFEAIETYKLNWKDTRQSNATLKRAFQDIALQAGMHETRIDIIWSAGQAGFSANRDDFETEMSVFKSLLQKGTELSQAYTVTLHHFSSAGGLFEGQRFVRKDTEPVPRRAYGDIKLAQEQMIGKLPKSVVRAIYRPSSVYGYNGRGNRAGLVTALAERALAGQTIEIHGRADTIRDYVFVEDIGVFLARRIQERTAKSEIYFLTGGKPTSMVEMLKTVQRIMNKRLLFRFSQTGENTRHMSFDRSVFPTDWFPTPTIIGLKKTINDIQKDFV